MNTAATASPGETPAWKQLPTWYQISESDRMIPPDVQHKFAEQMYATTLSLNASHASYVSFPNSYSIGLISRFLFYAFRFKYYKHE
ncbi:MAG TPA: hypothetical protein VJ250_04055 [Nitrososphaeraceae archaeon]|nr:hypothetical protein [Nitrososphaeraceae archaeon]